MRTPFLAILLLAFGFCNAQIPCSLDTSFNSDGKLVDASSRLGEHVLVQSDGKILVACNPFGNSHVYLKRFNVDGSVDNTYGSGGKFTIQVMERRTSITGMSEFDGKIYICGNTTTDVGGTNTFPYVAAITSNGAYETSFGTNGVKKFNSFPDLYTCSSIHVESAGAIYVTGLEGLDNMFLMRLTTSGAFVSSFGSNGITYQATGNNDHWYSANHVTVDGNGMVLVTGKKYKANNGSTITPFWNLMVMRFTNTGSLDNSFASNGIALLNSNSTNFDEGKKLHVTTSNEYIICGSTYDGNDYDYTTLKLNNNGTPNTSFGVAGWVLSDLLYNQETENNLNSALLPDGRILMTGNEGTGDTVYFSLLMLNSNGTRDNVFGTNGVFRNIFNQNNNSSSSGMDLDANGKIVLAGYTRTCANGQCGPLYMAVSRYNNEYMQITSSTPSVESGIKLYPNPANSGGILTISDKEVEELTLVDANGKQIRILGTNGEFALPEVAAGFYNCLFNAKGELISRKILLQK